MSLHKTTEENRCLKFGNTILDGAQKLSDDSVTTEVQKMIKSCTNIVATSEKMHHNSLTMNKHDIYLTFVIRDLLLQ